MIIIAIIIKMKVIKIVWWKLIAYDRVEPDFMAVSTFLFSILGIMRFIFDIEWKSCISVMQSIFSIVCPKFS